MTIAAVQAIAGAPLGEEAAATSVVPVRIIGTKYASADGMPQRGGSLAVDLRGHPVFPSMGVNAPTRFEADIHDCEVWGKVPATMLWVG